MAWGVVFSNYFRTIGGFVNRSSQIYKSLFPAQLLADVKEIYGDNEIIEILQDNYEEKYLQ